MLIHEAIAATDPNRPFITRKAWMTGANGEIGKKLNVLSSHAIWLFDEAPAPPRPEKWTPAPADLRASDWIVCPPKRNEESKDILAFCRFLGTWPGLKKSHKD